MPPARTQTHIPALLTVPGHALKGSTQQVMGCSQEGMQITTVLFQLWKVAFSACLTLLLAVASACAAVPQAKCCLSAQARELLDIYTLLQEHKGRTAVSRWCRKVHQDHYMVVCIRRFKYKSKRPFMHEHIRQKKHETVLTSQGELLVQKPSLILRSNHNSAEAITKINLYLCGSLIYTEKQILNGFKFCISLCLCQSPHLKLRSFLNFS